MIYNISIDTDNVYIKNISIDINNLISIINKNNYFDNFDIKLKNINTLYFNYNNFQIISLKKFIDNNFLHTDNNFINYNNILSFFKKLVIFFKNCNSNYFSIINFDINDFIVINNKIYFISFYKFKKIKNNYITLNEIINYNNFISPELFFISSLPNTIHYKSYYFSIAIIFFHFFNQFDIDIYNLNKLKKDDFDNKVQKILLFFKGTPFFYFLKRILIYDTIHRLLIFI